MKITLVKKILADGSPCKKCGEVIGRLEDSGQMERIDEILVADERDPTSAGMLLAAELHNWNTAPKNTNSIKFAFQEDFAQGMIAFIWLTVFA